MPRRGFSLAVLIVNQLLAGVGVATGIARRGDPRRRPHWRRSRWADSPSRRACSARRSSRCRSRASPCARAGTSRSPRGTRSACVGAVLVIVAAASGMAVLVFLGLAAFGAGAAAGLQARFAATEVAAPGFEARSMSLVLWATTIGSVAGPLLSQTGDTRRAVARAAAARRPVRVLGGRLRALVAARRHAAALPKAGHLAIRREPATDARPTCAADRGIRRGGGIRLAPLATPTAPAARRRPAPRRAPTAAACRLLAGAAHRGARTPRARRDPRDRVLADRHDLRAWS